MDGQKLRRRRLTSVVVVPALPRPEGRLAGCPPPRTTPGGDLHGRLEQAPNQRFCLGTARKGEAAEDGRPPGARLEASGTNARSLEQAGTPALRSAPFFRP